MKWILAMFLAFCSACNLQGDGEQNAGINKNPGKPVVLTNDSLSRGFVYFSRNNGASWVDKSNGLPGDASVGLGGIAVFDSLLLIGIKQYGIYKFDVSLEQWIPLPTDSLIINSNLGSLTFYDGCIFAGTQYSGVFMSGDSGKTWTSVSSGLGDLTVRRFFINNSILYLGTNHGLYSFNRRKKNGYLSTVSKDFK